MKSIKKKKYMSKCTCTTLNTKVNKLEDDLFKWRFEYRRDVQHVSTSIFHIMGLLGSYPPPPVQ